MRNSRSPGYAPIQGTTRIATLFAFAVTTLAVMMFALAGTAKADQTVRLTLQPSADECTAWDQMTCSYLEVRDGNSPAPDPETDPEPTFLNMANLPGDVTVDAAISDTGEVTVQEDSVKFPEYPTSLENDLVGTVSIGIQIKADGNWTGTYNDSTGEMDLNAPLGLTFQLNCDPVANGTCGLIFGAEGNMGLWQVTPKGPVDPLTTGSLTGPLPPAVYGGTEWFGPLAEEGSPFDENGVGTLINNDLEIANLTASDCIDPTTIACSNPAIGGLIAPSLNGALGTVYDPADPTNDRDSAPGAIDMRLTFEMSEPPILESDPSELTFTGANDDGSQPLGTSSPAQATTLSALDAGDIEVRSIYTDGGDDDDFLVTNARSCGHLIESGGTCDVRLRFNPSATGARSSTLYASIVNPVTTSVEQVQLATLSGEGGTLPQGPTGPDGATGADGSAGPQGPQGPAGPRGRDGALVSISSNAAVALRTKARRIATVAARGGAVNLATPKRVRIRVRGKRFNVRIIAPRRIAKNKRGAIRVRGPRAAVRALRGRASAKLRVRVTVRSGNRTQAQNLRVRLR